MAPALCCDVLWCCRAELPADFNLEGMSKAEHLLAQKPFLSSKCAHQMTAVLWPSISGAPVAVVRTLPAAEPADLLILSEQSGP